jgi:hypothetical protein
MGNAMFMLGRMFLLVFCFTTLAQAAAVEELTLSIPQWVRASKISSRLMAAGVLRKIAVVKKVEGNYSPVNFDYDTTKTTYMEFIGFEQAQLTFEINKSGSVSKCSKDLTAVAKCLDVDLVLDVTGETWALSEYTRKRKKTQILIKAPAGEDKTYVRWVTSKLNYDGIILDQKEKYRLALVPPNVIPNETQVLLLEGGASKSLMKPGITKGSGLLVVKKIEGRYAILEVLITDGKQVETKFADKIIIERSKSNPVSTTQDTSAGSPTAEGSSSESK